MAAATVARMAMNPSILARIGNFLSPGKLSGMEKLMRFGPDIGFGAMAAVQTPGDLVDKSIAFGSVAGGGLLGGLGSAGAVRHFGKGKMSPEDLQSAMGFADMFGSLGGDLIAYPAGESVARVKDKMMGGQGETGWERLSRKEQQEMRKQMEADILRQYGIFPGTRSDDYLAQLGLA